MKNEVAVIRELPALQNLLAVDIPLAIEKGEEVVKQKGIAHLVRGNLVKFLLGSLVIAGVEFEVIKPTPRDPAVIDLNTGEILFWWIPV